MVMAGMDLAASGTVFIKETTLLAVTPSNVDRKAEKLWAGFIPICYPCAHLAILLLWNLSEHWRLQCSLKLLQMILINPESATWKSPHSLCAPIVSSQAWTFLPCWFQINWGKSYAMKQFRVNVMFQTLQGFSRRNPCLEVCRKHGSPFPKDTTTAVKDQYPTTQENPAHPVSQVHT